MGKKQNTFIKQIEEYKKQLDEGTLFPKEKLEYYDKQMEKGLEECENQTNSFMRDVLIKAVDGGGTLNPPCESVKIMAIWIDDTAKECEIYKQVVETGLKFFFATSDGDYKCATIHKENDEETNKEIKELVMMLIKCYEGSGYRLCWYGERGSKGEGEVL